MKRTTVIIGVLGIAVATGGCGREVVGVARPEAMLAWEPQPQDASARITTVKVGAARTYVGFSDGERFFKLDGSSTWAPYDAGSSGGCAQQTPQGPVTAFAISEAMTFASFAGTPGAFGIWHSPEDQPCWASVPVADEFLNLSASPFFDVELLAVGPNRVWVTHDLASSWAYEGPTTSLNFAGDARAVATGVSPSGLARAWLGDSTGHVYVSDDVATATATDQIRWQGLSPTPGFPARPTVAIAVDASRPRTVWITFAGLHADSLWTSDDGGATWRTPHGGALPLDEDAASDATFIGVSPVAAEAAAYVTALVPTPTGQIVSTSYWIADGSNDWWRL